MDLGLALSTYNSRAYDAPHVFSNKRSFSQLCFEHEVETSSTNESDVMQLPTLSLLPLTPINSNDHDQHCCHSSTTTITKSDADEGTSVGRRRPPVYCGRKKLRYNENDIEDYHNYVKVKMEGVGIARKIDLTKHNSFQSLNQTLMDMFEKCDDDQQYYELVYQDKEGDWLLAQDVSWRNFIQCAQRLKLLKSANDKPK